MMRSFLNKLVRPRRNTASFGRTDTGRTRRNNEDSFCALEDRRIYVVADGMGGHRAGEVASRLAVETLVECCPLDIVGRIRGNDEEIRHFLIRSFHRVNKEVMAFAGQSDGARGMGTTLVAAFIDGAVLHVCHVGDSRCYVADSAGIRLVTRDHVALAPHEGLVAERREGMPRASHILSRAIGFPFPEDPEYHAVSLGKEERILLCTDGLWSMVDEAALHQTLVTSPTPEAAADLLVRLANEAGGRDNITAVVVFVYP